MPAPVRRGDPGRVTVTLGQRSRLPAALLSKAALPTAVLLAALWAGPSALGSAATTVSRAGAGSLAAAASPSPARAKRVKLFVVPRRKPGRKPVTLYGIAARALGDGTRFMEIFRLNKGRLQPTGGRLRNPLVIRPGWILELPKDAHGPGVHLGRIPHVKPRPPAPRPAPSQSAAPTHSPAPVQSPAPAQPSASRTTSASFSPFQWSSTGSAFVLGGGVLVLALAGLAIFAVKRRRASRAGAVPAARAASVAGASPGTAAPRRSAPFTSASGASGAGLGRRRPTYPKAAGLSGRPASPLGGPTWPEPGDDDRTGAGAGVSEAAEPGSGPHDTAELHAAVLSASAELGRVAAHIAENLSALAEPLTEPKPAAEPDPPGPSEAGQPQPGKREADSDWSFLSLTQSPADH
jgi:hypothetical protein